MTTRERFEAVLNGERPDRLPVIEWAGYWDQTIRRWEGEGLAGGLDQQGITDTFGLDRLYQLSPAAIGRGCPQPPEYGVGIIQTETDYERILPWLYPQKSIESLERRLLELRPAHDRGEAAIWFSLEGFFWFPRELFGIENHLYAFYDEPELMHRINADQAAFCVRAVEAICRILRPEFMTFAEDMSYNHGPMLSKELFDQFMAPYYREVIPLLKEKGVKVLIDTDGFVEPLIPWFEECGIEGVLPLERQAGVDVNRIRAGHPEWIMLGGFDKLTMRFGEEAMRAEFERILPAMQSGRYVPGVDHQTPPDVSIPNYRCYVRLLKEYAERAAR